MSECVLPPARSAQASPTPKPKQYISSSEKKSDSDDILFVLHCEKGQLWTASHSSDIVLSSYVKTA